MFEKSKVFYVKAIYEPKQNNKEKLRIIGKEFFNRNRFKCKMIYKNKLFKLKEFIDDIDKNYYHKAQLKIKYV